MSGDAPQLRGEVARRKAARIMAEKEASRRQDEALKGKEKKAMPQGPPSSRTMSTAKQLSERLAELFEEAVSEKGGRDLEQIKADLLLALTQHAVALQAEVDRLKG